MQYGSKDRAPATDELIAPWPGQTRSVLDQTMILQYVYRAQT